MRSIVVAALFLAACQSSAPAPAGSEFQVIPLQHAAAPELANQLSDLVRGKAAGLDREPIAAFIADPRTNSILVRARPENMDAVRALVQQLDQRVPDSKP